jgi:hypothetical protein
MKSNTPRLVALAACVATLASCSSGSGPSTGTQVTFNVGTKAASASHLQAAFLSDTIGVGNDTLVIDSVKLVLRDIRFKRVEDSGCPDDDSTQMTPTGGDGHHGDDGFENGHDGHSDACETFNAGPFLLDLPLGGGVERAFAVTVDTGTYDQLRVKLHAPRPDTADAKDVAFLAAHPEFAGLSTRVFGSYKGTPFVFESKVTAKQRIRLNPPIVVADAATSVDVTIKIDISGWFKDAGGNLIDPATANAGGANEETVADNIRDSFHAFQDENHDCHNDHGSDND